MSGIAAPAGFPAGNVSLSGNLTFANKKAITLADDSNDGHIARLIILKSTFDVDRPWISMIDENGRHVAAFGYHTALIPALGGDVLKQVEIKTVASSTSADPADMRTRLAIQVDKQRITYGHTYTESLEVYQGENPITVGEGAVANFGLNLRTDPQDTVTAGASNFIIANFIAQIDQNDNAFLFIDVKPPYNSAPGTFTGPLGLIPAGNRGASLVFFRNVNSSSASNPAISVKKGDGTNTTSLTILAKTGVINSIGGVGLFGTTAPAAKPTVSGSRSANAALASLLTALASYGLVLDSSTA